MFADKAQQYDSGTGCSVAQQFLYGYVERQFTAGCLPVNKLAGRGRSVEVGSDIICQVNAEQGVTTYHRIC